MSRKPILEAPSNSTRLAAAGGAKRPRRGRRRPHPRRDAELSGRVGLGLHRGEWLADSRNEFDPLVDTILGKIHSFVSLDNHPGPQKE